MPQLTYANLIGLVAIAFGTVLAVFGIISFVMVVYLLIKSSAGEGDPHGLLGLLIFGPAAIIGLGIGALLVWLGCKRILRPPEAV